MRRREGSSTDVGPPPRPPRWEERLGNALLRVPSFARVPRRAPEPPPASLAPWEEWRVPRSGGRSGSLLARWFPAAGAPRGAVLLGHPGLEWGQSYFHRRGRIEALRAAGLHAMTFDLGGFGGSDDAAGFLDRDVADALDALARRAEGLPLHVWGVSLGGYWAHHVLARRGGVAGAVFEDVSADLYRYGPMGRGAARAVGDALRRLVPRASAFVPTRAHAPHLRVAACAYIGGGRDPGAPARDTRELARLARAECLVVPEAAHLAAIKLAPDEVRRLALATFARAEALTAAAG